MLNKKKQIVVYFYTSNITKYLQARLVVGSRGFILRHFRSHTEPYEEDYNLNKRDLLRAAIKQIQKTIGQSSLFFVEDTTIRINALSKGDMDFPGLAAKEWFATLNVPCFLHFLKSYGDRTAMVRSDIALHLPGIDEPVFFQGETWGNVTSMAPKFEENAIYPWLTPKTFNGIFLPENSTKPLGEMSIDESLAFDFRAKSLEALAERLSEYDAILNAKNPVYIKSVKHSQDDQLALFNTGAPSLVIVGPTCAGKTTLGKYMEAEHGYTHIEASTVLRSINIFECADLQGAELARCVLTKGGKEVVARRIVAQHGAASLAENFVITGFRAIEELSYLRNVCPEMRVVSITANERTRYERILRRARPGRPPPRSLREFRDFDREQAEFGLLHVSKEFGNYRITNEGTIQDFAVQAAWIVKRRGPKPAGVAVNPRPRHVGSKNRIFRCLEALANHSGPMTCEEISLATRDKGKNIPQNNVNKVLKRLDGLVQRLEVPNVLIRYEITGSGRAYLDWFNKYSFNKS